MSRIFPNPLEARDSLKSRDRSPPDFLQKTIKLVENNCSKFFTRIDKIVIQIGAPRLSDVIFVAILEATRFNSRHTLAKLYFTADTVKLTSVFINICNKYWTSHTSFGRNNVCDAI